MWTGATYNKNHRLHSFTRNIVEEPEECKVQGCQCECHASYRKIYEGIDPLSNCETMKTCPFCGKLYGITDMMHPLVCEKFPPSKTL